MEYLINYFTNTIKIQSEKLIGIACSPAELLLPQK